MIFFRNILARLGLVRRKNHWWETLTSLPVAAALIILFAAGSLLLLHTTSEKSKGQDSITSNAALLVLEEEYRREAYPLFVSYLSARSAYAESSDETDLSRWSTIAEESEAALLALRVPPAYRDFHLNAVIALSLDRSAIDDLRGQASDSGMVGSGGLPARGAAKLQDAETRWRTIVSQQEWLSW